jgi:hypothetical protein
MNSNLKRLAAVVAVSAMGIFAPVAGASAATTPTRAGLAFRLAPGWPFWLSPSWLDYAGPTVPPGGTTVTGPTVKTIGNGQVFVGTTVTTTGVGAGPGG